MTCCIKKFPWDPAGACGATAADIEKAIQLGVVIETAQQLQVSEDTDDPDDGWREHCRNTYVKCQDQKKPRWVGNCYDCFRWCEGQRQWPFHMCWPQPK